MADDDIIGIDLGTTNSLVGAVDAGFPILFADEQGQRITPSVVHYPKDGDPIVGAAALRMRSLQPGRTVSSVKRHMGQSLTPANALSEQRNPEEVSAEILGKLKRIAEAALESSVSRAVITVPAYFNDGQRSATKRAGERAGLSVERILNEPTAAALAYGLDKLNDRSKVAVYDFGGGTFDISILEMRDGVFQVLSTAGNTQLGGDDIDRALLDYLCEKADVETPDPILLAKLLDEAIQTKHALSDDESYKVTIPFLKGDTSFQCEITREQFERIARPLVEKTRSLCHRAVSDAKLEFSDLDKVVLVGGSTRMPICRSIVEDIFRQASDTSQNPDEAVALGAVIQGGMLSGKTQNIILLDVTPLSLGIETFGGLMNVILPRNTTIPAKAGELFTNAVANQRSMKIRVLQGEREMARDNWELGQVEILFDPGAKGSARVGVQFEIDANGILTVLTRDTKTDTDTVLEIQSAAVDVNDEAVEQMITESVDHAFDDMNERIWTEAKMKSDELLPAVDAALDQVGAQLSDVQRSAIEGAAGTVRKALQSKDARQLKEANQALDSATEHAAALLVEKAMEESLKRQGLI